MRPQQATYQCISAVHTLTSSAPYRSSLKSCGCTVEIESTFWTLDLKTGAAAERPSPQTQLDPPCLHARTPPDPPHILSSATGAPCPAAAAGAPCPAAAAGAPLIQSNHGSYALEETNSISHTTFPLPIPATTRWLAMLSPNKAAYQSKALLQ